MEEESNPGMTEDGGQTLDWGGLAPLVIHQTKLLILEAMLWVDEPLSAVDIVAMCNGTIGTSSISYHLKSLDGDLSVVRLYDEKQIRGAWKKNYYFRDRTPASRR